MENFSFFLNILCRLFFSRVDTLFWRVLEQNYLFRWKIFSFWPAWSITALEADNYEVLKSYLNISQMQCYLNVGTGQNPPPDKTPLRQTPLLPKPPSGNKTLRPKPPSYKNTPLAKSLLRQKPPSGKKNKQ